MLRFSLILALASAVTGLRLTSPTETQISFKDISAAAETIHKEYVEKVGMVPYHLHGVVPSESLALMSAAMAAKVDVMIESGTAHGQNAEVMARFLQDKPVKIYSIDTCELYGKERCELTSKRLENFTNINFVFPGDATKELPKILKEHQGKKIGVFIDGPKGMMAADLCRNVVKASVDVKFCAIHDVSPTSGEPKAYVKRLKTWERQVLLSYEDEWHNRWKGLDAKAIKAKPTGLEMKVKDTEGFHANPGLAILAGLDTMSFGVKGDEIILHESMSLA